MLFRQKGVEPVPAKVQAIQQWPTPSSSKALRSFLGLAGFYQKFIHGYASITVPLTNLLARDSFTWSTEAQTTFNDLKAALTTALVLMLPDFTLPFTVETDASGVGMGAMLS